MPTPIKYREIRMALLAAGCIYRDAKGDHEVWYCPCGKNVAVVNSARVVSAGVVGDLIKKMACLKEGWLQ
ncbi:MAG: type II toxin-antitoxin system HicA family toxin [Dermatophilaceae bacterium]